SEAVPKEPGAVDLTQPAEPSATGLVSRVVICCNDGVVALMTAGATLIYQLDTCEVPLGSYDATVEVDGDNVRWTLGTHRGEGFIEQAKFRYRIRPGQPNPATLLRRQDKVPVDSVGSIILPTETPDEFRCLITMGPQELIAGRSFRRDLFKPQKFEKEIWSHAIPLGQFGWVDFSSTARASASGEFTGGYGPGVLSSICLYRSLGSRKYGGHANFKLDGNLAATIALSGGLDLAAHYLGVLPVAVVDGSIDAVGIASGRAAIDSDLNVEFETPGQLDALTDPGNKKRRWSVSSRSTLTAEASLRVAAETRLAVTFLTRELWSQTWKLVDKEVGVTWRGTLVITPDFGVEFEPGDLVVTRGGASSAGVSSAGGSGGAGKGGGGTAKPSGGIDITRLVDLAKAIYDEKSAKTEKKPVIEVRVPPYHHYDLGPPGFGLEGTMKEKVKDFRVNSTLLDYESFKSNIAVLLAEVDGVPRYFVSPNTPGELHSETLIFRQVEAVDRTYRRIRLISLYTERSPCGNCRRDLIGIRRLRKQDFGVFYAIKRTSSADTNARRLMEAYIVNKG
ncbi:MAG: hypothetical protein LC808_23465, partial [Actinobacteria bacterium]|nr:hypothetical protein [Actinomycetota bacterium]